MKTPTKSIGGILNKSYIDFPANESHVDFIMTRGGLVYFDDRVRTMTDGKWRDVNKQYLEYRFPKP